MNKGVLLTAAITASVIAVVAGLSGHTKEDAPRPGPEFEFKTECADGPRVACDALETKGKKSSYKRIQTASADCVRYKIWADGGVETVGTSRNAKRPPRDLGLAIVEGSCGGADSTVVGDGGVTFTDLACACRKAKGDCWIFSDGGAIQAPKGKTLGPGYPGLEAWAGEGCQPKACTELLGQSSWPTECPR